MRKVHLWNIIFLIVEIIAFIPLTAAVFGDRNPDILMISAIIFGAGMVGNCVCVIMRAIGESKKE